MGYSLLPLVDSFYKLAKTDKDKYQDWIEENVKYPRGGCFFYSAVMALIFPELKLIKGKHSKQHKNDTAHFFLEDEVGNFIDPTSSQYQSGELTRGKVVSAKKNVDAILEDTKRFNALPDKIKSKIKGSLKVEASMKNGKHISDPDLFEAVAAIEGKDWVKVDIRGGRNSLTDLIKAYKSYLEVKDEYSLNKFDAEIAQLFDHSGVVYGEGGMSRWVIRGECLVLDGASTHAKKKQMAKDAGFDVIE